MCDNKAVTANETSCNVKGLMLIDLVMVLERARYHLIDTIGAVVGLKAIRHIVHLAQLSSGRFCWTAFILRTTVTPVGPVDDGEVVYRWAAI